MLIALQHNVAHLGIVTGLCLSEAAVKYAPKWIGRPIILSAILASISTSLAEIFRWCYCATNALWYKCSNGFCLNNSGCIDYAVYE